MADSNGRRFQGKDSIYSIKRMLPVQEDAFWTYECCMLDAVQNIERFIADVLTHTATWDDHIKALNDLFQRVRKARLTIRPTKGYVGYDEVEFLGHNVSCNRIAMDENKLMKIHDTTPPKTKTQVRSFLGLAGYYRKFVNNYAHVTAPLTDLVKK